MAANPLQAVGVLLVIGISDRIEEVAISPGSADILWWAAPGCFDKARVGDARHGISDTLDADRVFPAVSEVVKVFLITHFPQSRNAW